MYNLGDIKGGYTLINDGELPHLISQPNRPEGIHLSNILSKIFGYSDVIEPETKSSQCDFEVTNLMELGLMFELAYKHYLKTIEPDRYILEPDPLVFDGIHMTPDIIDLDREAIADTKFTTKSAKACPGGVREDDHRFKYWEMQVKAYCYGSGFGVGQLRVCHVNGIWAFLDKRLTPQEKSKDDTVFNIWEREYSEGELEANWAVIMAHKERG